MDLTLVRNYLENCTPGNLMLGKEELGKTIELPWKGNQKDISCIPAGEYQMIPFKHEKYGRIWYLENRDLGVALKDSLRTEILIHPANFPHELLGCIAPGTTWHTQKWGVAHSRIALSQIVDRIGHTAHTLTIV